MVLFSPVFLSVQDVVPKERTIEVSVAEMAFPHLQWNFDMTFRSLVLKCSSIFLRESTRELENRICSAEELLGWLPPSASLAAIIACLSIAVSGSD